MSKIKTIQQLTNLLAGALRHKIGAIVNSSELYKNKYEKEAQNLLKAAQKVSLRENWNIYDKEKIKEELRYKLKTELEKCTYLNSKKFDFMNSEINEALKLLGLL